MENSKVKVDNLYFYYRGKKVLDCLSMNVEEKKITAIVGPSGVGKTTLLTVLNRLYESIPQCKVEGTVEIKFDNRYVSIYSMPLTTLRKKVGMVFQTPNPLPLSISKNIAFPLKLTGVKDKSFIAGKVEAVLKNVSLWDEVKDRLDEMAINLSGGQQQRLCIARAMVMEPEILLLDEPTSSLDMEAASKVEELLSLLINQCTLIVVSHYADLVKRVADHVLTLRDGRF